MASSAIMWLAILLAERSNDRVWNYIYDAFNRLTREIDPAGNATVYTYDKNGNKTSVVDPVEEW